MHGHREVLKKSMPYYTRMWCFYHRILKRRLKAKTLVETIKEYAQTATTHTFEVRDKKVNYWPNTSVVKPGYFVVYEMNKKTFRETGTELWTLVRNNYRWQLVYRVFISHEAI